MREEITETQIEDVVENEVNDLRTEETKRSRLVYGNPKRHSDWMKPRVAPIRSNRNKIDPDDDRNPKRKFKITEHRKAKRARKNSNPD